MKFSPGALFLLSALSIATQGESKKYQRKPRKQRRRRLKRVSGSHECTPLFNRRLAGSESVFNDCAQEFYKLSVNVFSGHIGLTASPMCEKSLDRNACREKCFGLLIHSPQVRISSNKYILEKQLHPLTEEDSSEVKEGLPLGTFALNDLMEAYDTAEVDPKKDYSLYTNNCASVLIQIGGLLGIDSRSPEIIKYVSRKLSNQAMPELMEEFTYHDSGMTLIDAHNEDEDAVIEDFVSTYIHARV